MQGAITTTYAKVVSSCSWWGIKHVIKLGIGLTGPPAYFTNWQPQCNWNIVDESGVIYGPLLLYASSKLQ